MHTRTTQRPSAQTEQRAVHAQRDFAGQRMSAAHGTADLLSSLQRSHGNRFVQRMLAAERVMKTEASACASQGFDAPTKLPQNELLSLTKSEAAFDDDDAEVEAKSENGDAGVPAPAPAPPAAPAAPPAPAPAVTPPITWAAEGYSSDNNAGASTTIEQAFVPVYTATKDTAASVWRMRVTSLGGGVDITVHTGNSRDATASPPTTEAEAQEAVTVMKGYYARGSRGAWHTEGASKVHEEHHYREWKCSAEHYWGIACPAITSLTAPVAGSADAAAAVTAMKPAADAKVTSFKDAARTYWMTLADNASSKPYAAGQAVLNGVVTGVQTLAGTKGWTVDGGTTVTAGTEPPCYQPFAAYTP